LLLFRRRAVALYSVASLLQRSQVGQHELGIYDFDVAHRINGRADVMNVGIFKTTHHLHDRLDFANMVEELITETFTRARAFDQPAMSTNSIAVGVIFFERRNLGDLFRRGSGTITTPTFGSIVQNG
jgi:hypothetical protein